MSPDDFSFARPGFTLPPRNAKAGELLFEFHRERDHKCFRCELRFHGESFGWEAQFLEQGELFTSHGGFVTKALAIQWAEEERKFLEGKR
jgi:hypothetical protein